MCYGRGAGVGRGRAAGAGLAVGVGVGLPGVTVAVGVGLGVPDCAQYLAPVWVFWDETSRPPQTIISLPVHIAV